MLNGTGTTWDVAKVMVLNDISKVRSREKNYRRLLIRRVDRCKPSEGILQLEQLWEIFVVGILQSFNESWFLHGYVLSTIR